MGAATPAARRASAMRPPAWPAPRITIASLMLLPSPSRAAVTGKLSAAWGTRAAARRIGDRARLPPGERLAWSAARLDVLGVGDGLVAGQSSRRRVRADPGGRCGDRGGSGVPQPPDPH